MQSDVLLLKERAMNSDVRKSHMVSFCYGICAKLDRVVL